LDRKIGKAVSACKTTFLDSRNLFGGEGVRRVDEAGADDGAANCGGGMPSDRIRPDRVSMISGKKPQRNQLKGFGWKQGAQHSAFAFNVLKQHQYHMKFFGNFGDRPIIDKRTINCGVK